MSDSAVRLQEAFDTGTVVEIARNIRRAETVAGFVVLLSPTWVVLHYSEDIRLNGYVAVRLSDIRKVVAKPSNDLTVRALAFYGDTARAPGGVSCLDARTLVDSAGKAFELVTIYNETEHTDECYIGVVMATNTRTVRLLEINPRAEWERNVTLWPLKEITRVDFGGRYEQALIDLGGSPESIA